MTDCNWRHLQHMKWIVLRMFVDRCRWLCCEYKTIADFGPLYENMTSSTKPEVNDALHCRHEDRSTATVNKYRKSGEIWTCSLWDMREDRHKKDKQTDTYIQTRWSQYFSLLRVEVNSVAPPDEYVGNLWLLAAGQRQRRYCRAMRHYGPLGKNMTSSTKPEVHSILHCRHSSEQGRAMATVHIIQKLSWSLVCGF